MKQLIFIIIALLFSSQLPAQEKTDREHDQLLGPVKSIRSYKIDSEGEEAFYHTTCYNQQGMKVKYVCLNGETDSIEYHYDAKNRLVMKIEYERKYESRNDDKYISSSDTTAYEYGQCDQPIRKTIYFGLPDKVTGKRMIFDTRYKRNKECCITEEVETGRGSTQITTIDYDAKGRKTKVVFAYRQISNPETITTYTYNDQERNRIRLEYNPQKKVYREKEITRYNETNEVIEKNFYYQQAWGKSTTFDKGSPAEPDSVYNILRYRYDEQNRLTAETQLDSSMKEERKKEITYNESGLPVEESYYQQGQLLERIIHRYAGNLLMEKKKFVNDSKKPETVDTWTYDDSGRATQRHIKGNNTYEYRYIYDQYGNNTRTELYMDTKLYSTEHNDFIYY